jgi:predicted permease
MRIDYAKVTPEIWDVARIQPLMGRVFTEDDIDAGNEKVAVLTYGLWTQLYGDSEDIFDRDIRVDDDAYQVIGVMPQSFSLIHDASRMWIPKVFSERERSAESRGMHGFQAIGRLKRGVSLASARQELDAIYQGYLDENPERRKFAEETGESFGIAPVSDWVSDRSSGSMVLSVQGATVLILLIGCLNVAGILLLRGQRRVRELTMRHALGASRLRIARQMITETVLLFTMGGAVGLAVARWAMTLLSSQIGFQDAFQLGGLPEINTTVFLLTLGLILVCGLVAGSIPAYVAARGMHGNTLQTLNMGKTSGGHRNALQNTFVIAQVALAFVLLVGTGVLIRNVEGLLTEGFGCEIEDRIAVEVALPEYRFGSSRTDTRERINPLKDEVLKQVRALPGVQRATFANRVPLSKNHPIKNGFQPSNYEPGPGEMVFAIWYQVDSAYFQTMGIPLLSGRGFESSDTSDSPAVVVVSETVADRYYQGRNPINETLRFWGVDCTIVGVVGETLDVPMHYGDAPTLYFHYTQWPVTRQVDDATLVVQTELPLENMREPIGNVLHSIDPMLTFEFTTMEQIREKAMVSRSAPMEIAGLFAFAAILLAAMGIYGILAASVSGRTREIGIRLSLGARKSSIFRGVLARGARLTLIGLLLGSALSVFPLRWLNTLMTEVNATSLDMPIFAALLVVAVALLASYLPARRAIKTDPAFTLRYE